MSVVQKFTCEICGTEKRDSHHWFLAELAGESLTIRPWSEVRARGESGRHFCGEAHLQQFITRFLSAPPKAAPKPLDPGEQDMTSIQAHLVKKLLQQEDGPQLSAESEEIFDLLAATEAAIKGRVTVDRLGNEWFDA